MWSRALPPRCACLGILQARHLLSTASQKSDLNKLLGEIDMELLSFLSTPFPSSASPVSASAFTGLGRDQSGLM